MCRCNLAQVRVERRESLANKSGRNKYSIANIMNDFYRNNAIHLRAMTQAPGIVCLSYRRKSNTSPQIQTRRMHSSWSWTHSDKNERLYLGWPEDSYNYNEIKDFWTKTRIFWELSSSCGWLRASYCMHPWKWQFLQLNLFVGETIPPLENSIHILSQYS